MSFHNILMSFLGLVGISISIVFLIIFYNLYTKSFRPQKSFIVMAFIVGIFVVNFFMAMFYVSRVATTADMGVEKIFEKNNSYNSLY